MASVLDWAEEEDVITGITLRYQSAQSKSNPIRLQGNSATFLWRKSPGGWPARRRTRRSISKPNYKTIDTVDNPNSSLLLPVLIATRLAPQQQHALALRPPGPHLPALRCACRLAHGHRGLRLPGGGKRSKQRGADAGRTRNE